MDLEEARRQIEEMRHDEAIQSMKIKALALCDEVERLRRTQNIVSAALSAAVQGEADPAKLVLLEAKDAEIASLRSDLESQAVASNAEILKRGRMIERLKAQGWRDLSTFTELRKVLRDVEWQPCLDSPVELWKCAECGEIKPEHAPDCALAAALSPPRPSPPTAPDAH